MKKEKIRIEEQAKLLLNEFKEVYENKNGTIDGIILKGQNELNNGKIPQIVLQHAVGAIYRAVVSEKVTVGDMAGEILKKMDKLSRSNGYLPFGTIIWPVIR